jgi:hypothetical protein
VAHGCRHEPAPKLTVARRATKTGVTACRLLTLERLTCSGLWRLGFIVLAVTAQFAGRLVLWRTPFTALSWRSMEMGPQN